MRGYLAALSALCLASCLTDEGQGPLVPSSLTAVEASNNQVGQAGGKLPKALKVLVLTEDGQPALRASVAWEIVNGPAGASLSGDTSLANGTGAAQVVLQLGPEGAYTVRASLAVDPSKAITLTATAGPAPMLTGVTPATFSGSNIVLLTGQNFTEETRFEIGGKVARILAGSLDATSASVFVPSCLMGGSVSIRALYAGAVSPAIVGTFTASTAPIVLEVGEYLSISADDVAGCASIPAADVTGAQYLIAPQSVSRVVDDEVEFRFGTGTVIPSDAPVKPRPRDFALEFHNYLRRTDAELPSARLSDAAREDALLVSPVTAGDRRDFVICNNLDSCRTNEEFSSLRAEARYVGNRAAIYVDQDAPSGGLSDSDLQQLGQRFDDILYAVDTEAFGAESDVDGNNLVIILLSPIVNALVTEQQCENSFVSGFFFSIDINPLFKGDPRSNQGEVFYALVPDSQGLFSCSHTAEQVLRSVPVTFVHEFQHMISYHQHVLLRGGESEVGWLNEGLSHVAEELAAFRYLDLGDSTRFSRFAIGNLANAYDYLLNPEGFPAIWDEGTGELEQRGADWLFLRWMMDRYGESILRSLSETVRTGADNVEAATGEPVERLLSEWFLSNWVSDLPNFEVPERLVYTTWNFRTTFASLNNQSPNSFPVPFPLEPAQFGTLTPFADTGFLRSGTGLYYILTQESGEPGRALEFTTPAGQPLGDDASPVLNIIRIR